tara:strand:- start:644 stop:1054 length:411 start_codon:yes stop_codon:yes gene_type:complete
MKNFIIAFALMFSALTTGQMSFTINSIDITTPMDSEANLGWFMSEDILLSFGMSDWDNYNLGARYYTGMFNNMFIEANTKTVMSLDDTDEVDYVIGAAFGWTKSLGIWKLQFEPMIVIDDIQDVNPHLAWGLRFNL